jgi:hypothetical protein
LWWRSKIRQCSQVAAIWHVSTSDVADLEKASAAEVAESVVVELIFDINPSKLQGDVSEVDSERGR